MTDIQIRRARADDADRLARLGAETFADTFAHLYPPQDLTAYLAQAHTPALYADWAADAEFGLWIAERGGEALGYALAGPCHLPHPEVTPACGELWRIYVRRETQGSGLGGRLLARRWTGWPAPAGAWIGVWSRNHRAQRLYARHGFAKVGEYQFPVGATLDDEFILSRAPA